MKSPLNRTSTRIGASLREFILFMALVPMLVGYFSVISDNLYTFSASYTGIIANVWMLLAVILNDFAIWFFLATFVGWRYGRSPCSAILRAVLFSVSSISLYLALTPLLYPGSSVSEGMGGHIIWLTMAALGGAVGGAMGYYAPKRSLVLVPLVALSVFRLSELRSWETWLGISRNVVILAITLSVCLLWVIKATSWIVALRAKAEKDRPDESAAKVE